VEGETNDSKTKELSLKKSGFKFSNRSMRMIKLMFPMISMKNLSFLMRTNLNSLMKFIHSSRSRILKKSSNSETKKSNLIKRRVDKITLKPKKVG
jgi:hypothetical protein